MVRFVFILLFVIIPFSHAKAVPSCNETTPVWTDCFGTYTWHGVNNSKGHEYSGEWKNGVFEGHGTYYFLSDNIAKGEIFEGQFKDGERNGQGTLTFTNGVKGVGTWRNGKLNGPSVLYNENGSVYREVIFKDGVIVE